MKIVKATNLACPLDGSPLATDGRQLLCASGHSFDPARQGYVHLLPVQYKKSRDPGDSKAMVEARSRFLDRGIYAPISRQLNALGVKFLSEKDTLSIVDAGCGEGYYLDRFCAVLKEDACRAGSVSLIGLDISKPAILAATRRNRGITWIVASNRNPSLLKGTVDMIFCMFGFPDYEAFSKALCPGGKLILVDAGEEHLLELRKIIYPEVRKSPPPSLDTARRFGFRLLASESLRYLTPELRQEQIADLLIMTPHLYRATKEGKEAAARLNSLSLTVDVSFRVLEC